MKVTYDPETAYDRSEAALLGLLHALGAGVSRAKLIKLTYLMDESHYRVCGQTLTGFAYEWDGHGPNASGNAILNKLDGLSEGGAVVTNSASASNGSDRRKYRIAPEVDALSLPLSGDDWIEIHTAVHNYGGLSAADVARKTKSTAPAQKARNGDRLVLQQDPPLTPEEIASDPFWRETFAAMNNPGKRISIEELRERCAQ